MLAPRLPLLPTEKTIVILITNVTKIERMPIKNLS